jgi:hypothetical protein
MISNTAGWAVGSAFGGLDNIIQWDGNTWTVASSPTNAPLQSVKMHSAFSGWATGFGGTLLHWNGYEWKRVNSPTNHILYAVSVVPSSSEAWIAGLPGPSTRMPIILRYIPPALEPVTGVSIYGPDVAVTNSEYLFTAAVQPIGATLPVTYTWETSDHAPITYISGVTNTIGLEWNSTGAKSITVTAANDAGSATAATQIEVGHATAFAEPGLSSALIYTNTEGYATILSIPGGAVDAPTSLVYMAHNNPASASPAGLSFLGQAFSLNAYQNGAPQTDFAFLEPVVATVNYDPAYAANVNENETKLYYWSTQESMWRDVANSCEPASLYVRQPGQVTVSLCHLTQFALFGPEQFKIYLPSILR